MFEKERDTSLSCVCDMEKFCRNSCFCKLRVNASIALANVVACVLMTDSGRWLPWSLLWYDVPEGQQDDLTKTTSL